MSSLPLIPYIRQSRAKERTISLDEQRRVIETWAAREGVPLAEPLVEQGVSGSRSWKDRALGQAVAACEARRAAGIIVAFQDRLSRENGLATAEVWEALDRAGARLVAAGEGLDTAAGDQELLFSIKAAIAREQWKRHKANWAAAQRRAVEAGQHLAAWVPVGYVRGDDGRLLPDPVLAPVVRELYELRAAGGSWSECAALFLEHGVPRHGDDAHWSHKALQRLIKNRVYLGEAFHGEFVNRHAHEPLVEPALWRAAQSRGAAAKVRREPDDALLAGVLRCAGCGRPLKFERARDRYRCRRGINAGPPCPAPASVNRAGDFEELTQQAFLRLLPALYELPAEAPVELEPLRRAVAAAKADYEGLLAADFSDIDPVAFREAVASHRARLDDAEDALRRAEDEAAVSSAATYLDDQHWATLSKTERRRWLRDFGVTVTVTRGKERAVERAELSVGEAPAGLRAVTFKELVERLPETAEAAA